MSRLYLRCAICDRQQADGLISSAMWGRLELPAGAEIEHPALKGSLFRVCPGCVERHPGWEQSLLESFGLSSNHGPPAGWDSAETR